MIDLGAFDNQNISIKINRESAVLAQNKAVSSIEVYPFSFEFETDLVELWEFRLSYSQRKTQLTNAALSSQVAY